MCPVTGTAAASGTIAALQLGVSAASAAAGVASSYMDIEQQNERAEQNAQSAKDAYYAKAAAMNQRIREERVSAGQKKRDAALKRKRAQSTAKVAAAAGNVKGQSVERLLEDYARSEARMRDRIDQQTEANVASIQEDKKGLQAEAQNRINSVQPAGMEKLFGSVVKAGTQAVGSYLDYEDTMNPSGGGGPIDMDYQAPSSSPVPTSRSRR